MTFCWWLSEKKTKNKKRKKKPKTKGKLLQGSKGMQEGRTNYCKERCHFETKKSIKTQKNIVRNSETCAELWCNISLLMTGNAGYLIHKRRRRHLKRQKCGTQDECWENHESNMSASLKEIVSIWRHIFTVRKRTLKCLGHFWRKEGLRKDVILKRKLVKFKKV